MEHLARSQERAGHGSTKKHSMHQVESVEKGILETYFLRTPLDSTVFAGGRYFLIPEAFALRAIMTLVL
jgi:hypothetical protein